MKIKDDDKLLILGSAASGWLLFSAWIALLEIIYPGTGDGAAAARDHLNIPADFWMIGFLALLGLCALGAGLWLQLDIIIARLSSGRRGQSVEPDSMTRTSTPLEPPYTNGTLTVPLLEPARMPEETLGLDTGCSCLDGEALQESTTTTCTSRPFFPRVVITKELLIAIHGYIDDFNRKQGPDLEIGGMLVGEYEPGTASHPAIVRLQGFINAGPKAECRPSSILMDAEYQGRMLQGLQLQHPCADVQGMYHLHPETFDECSSGDHQTDWPTTNASGTGILVFVIVTRNNPKPDPLSLRVGDLKFDFFVMARQLGPRYHKVQPIVEEGPLLQPEPSLARLVEIKGKQARADWALLQQIQGLGPFSLCEITDGEQSGLWLTAATGHHERGIHVMLRHDGAMRLFLGTNQAPEQEYKGPWIQPDLGAHIFVSQLVLLGLEHLRGNGVLPAMGRHFGSLIDDKHRLVAEVQAMRERFGDEPQLFRDGNQLSWQCVVRQNGREFPIAIQYPSSYPYDPPRIRSLSGLEAGCPHLLCDDTLCWIDSYGSHSEWNPGRDTAATALVAAHRWFSCYLIWLTLGHWPESAND